MRAELAFCEPGRDFVFLPQNEACRSKAKIHGIKNEKTGCPLHNPIEQLALGASVNQLAIIGEFPAFLEELDRVCAKAVIATENVSKAKDNDRGRFIQDCLSSSRSCQSSFRVAFTRRTPLTIVEIMVVRPIISERITI